MFFHKNYMFKFLLLLLSFLYCTLSEDVSDESFEEYYQKGIQNYLLENWSECKSDLLAALTAYKKVLTGIADCRSRCANEEPKYLNSHDIEDMYFYERMVKKTLCFMKCKRLYYKNIDFEYHDTEALKDIENRTVYLYLQNCFYKENEMLNAASAIFTYLIIHPKNEMAKQMLTYYLENGVNQNEITNLEAEEYFLLYIKGINSYNAENWKQTIDYIEETIKEYFAADDKCRMLCEGPFDQGWLPDLTTSISNHFTYCLKCKQKCSEKLKTLDGLQGYELLADFYNYLQFSYFKLKKYQEALQCVASFLLLFPNDETMIYNKNLYLKHGKLSWLKPRSEIVYYATRDKYEKKFLKFIHEEFISEMKLNGDYFEEESNSILENISNNTKVDKQELSEKNKQNNKPKVKKTKYNKNPFDKYISKKTNNVK